MAQEFHFHHHKLEAQRNISRLRIALALIVIAAVGAYLPTFLSNASVPANTGSFEAESMTISGTTTNHAIGDPTASGGAAMELYINGSVDKTTATPASKRITVYAFGTQCAGAPQMTVKLDGSNVLTAAVVNTTGYLTYVADINIAAGNHSVAISYNNDNYVDPNCDRNLIVDKVEFTPAPVAATPVPTPVPTVKPTVAPTPVPAQTTPRPTTAPAKTPTPAPVQAQGQAAPRPAAAAAPKATAKPASFFGIVAPAAKPVEDTVPTVPGDLEAMVTGDNAIITLRWKASTAGTGITGYHIERTSDSGKSWAILSSATPDLTYMDNSAAFSIHYTYRVSAISQSGKVSDYASVDATTGNFVVTSVTTKVGNYYSDDKLAAAEVPAGALGKDANCSMVTMPITLATSVRKIVAGAYSVVCKDSAGKVLSEFSQPIKWTIQLKGKLRGVNTPDASTVSTTGASGGIPGALYDPKLQVMRFNQSTSGMVAVTADINKGVGPGFVVFLVILGAAGVGFVVLLRSRQLERYHDYLLQKYYNL